MMKEKETIFANVGRKTGEDSALCFTESREESLG